MVKWPTVSAAPRSSKSALKASIRCRTWLSASAARSAIASTAALTTASVGSTCTVRVAVTVRRSEEHTSELQSRENLVCRLLLEKKKERTDALRSLGSYIPQLEVVNLR